MNQPHIPVLLKEILTIFATKPGMNFLDCTLGRGGHAYAIFQLLEGDGLLVGFDQDSEAIKATTTYFAKSSWSNFHFIHANFKNLEYELVKAGIIVPMDGILFDLGLSSPQLDNPERGFSYHHDGPLDMRMDQTSSLTAATIVNTYEAKELKNILQTYGEEKYANLIANQIIKARENKTIETTLELVAIIKQGLPQKILKQKSHPCRKTFQALRITVNKELAALLISLNQAIKLLKPGGKLAVISFHSLEDRIIKTFFNKYTKKTNLDHLAKLPIKSKEVNAPYYLYQKKVICPTAAEIKQNNRSRSAKLRILIKSKEMEVE